MRQIDIIKNLLPFSLNRGLIILSMFLAVHSPVLAQKEFDGIRGTQHWMLFSDAPNSFYHYLAGQAYDLLDKRGKEVARLHSLQDWQKRQQLMRATLSDAVGRFPEKTPLHAKITGTVNKEGYRIENIIYESQPGYYVTSSLFIPDGLKNGKGPVVIYCSGHSDSGYRSASYQHEILNLVKKGFVVFAFDPMGQGERLQYYNPETGKSRFQWPSYEHSYPGAQLFVTGNTLASYFIWDGIRAVDYLLTRKETDPTRIGITGRSGGGTQSAFIAAFDDRIKAAAPQNYFTNFTRLYQAMGPQDAEQNFFNGIGRGIDMADLLEVRAPKPALMVTTTRDMFPIQGAIETEEEVSKIYQAYHSEDKFRRVADDTAHAATRKNREATYAFFQKYLDNPGDSTDEDIQPLKGELRVTQTRQLSTSLKGETAFSLNKMDAEKRMDKLKALRKNISGYFPGIIKSAKELSGYREPGDVSKPVFTGQIQRNGYVVQKYFVKGEGNYVIPYLLMKPEKPVNKALIYLNPAGKTAASAEGGEMEWFVKNGFTVLAPDIIGTGEMGPGVFKGDSYVDSVSYNLWFASILVGRSIVGIQAADVEKLTKLLKQDNNIQEIYGLAKNEMSPVLLHAAAFNKDITRIALIEPYSSYRSVVMNADYNSHFLHSTVPASIGIYDLPDLAASLAPRALLMAGITDGTGSSTNAKDINEDTLVIKAAYQYRNVENQLQIIPAAENYSEAYNNWIK